MPTPHNPQASQSARVRLGELRRQLDTLVGVSDALRAQLEAQRDQAAQSGDVVAANALEQGILQVARVRNDVRAACHDLDAVALAAA